MKPQLTPDSDARTKLRALVAAMDQFGADEAQLICRDDHDKVTSVAVVVIGEDAAALERWLKRREKKARRLS